MEHLRTRWTALVAALFLIISVAGVAGAAHVVLPAVAAPQAQEQAAQHDEDDDDQGEDEDEDTTNEEDEDTDEDEDGAPEADAEGAQGEHGAAVSAVAQNKECIGGPNENHGWAVSQVARGLQVPVAGECPVWDPEAIVTDDTESAGDLKVKGGKSAEHRQDKKPKTHGRWAPQP